MTITDIATGALYGTCDHCVKLRPLQPDGRLAIHYLRRRIASGYTRKRCAGSRRPPRSTHATEVHA